MNNKVDKIHTKWDNIVFDIKEDISTYKPLNSIVESFQEANYRASAYLTYIGAKFNHYTNRWDFDGNIICTYDNFLVFNGKLTVEFGYIKGDFICINMGLIYTEGLPDSCNELILEGNNITDFICNTDAKVYILSYNNISCLNIYPSDNTYHIDISNNNLIYLPFFNDIHLNYFDCSYNLNLNNLTNCPNSDIIKASNCNIYHLSDSILCTNTVSSLNLSFNRLKDLKNIPAFISLNCSNNSTLTSANGINYLSIEEQKHIDEIDLSYTSLENLNFIPENIYDLNVESTNICSFDSNSLKNVYTLTISHCNNFTGSYINKDLNITNLYLDEGLTKDLSIFTYNVGRICNYTTHQSVYFFNNKINEIENLNSLDYYNMYIDHLYENYLLKHQTLEVIMDQYNIPNEYEQIIKNCLNSTKTVNKFNL